LAKSIPANRVCDQSTSFEPEYDIYEDNHPENNNKAQLNKD
jgi:hypothetical protein